MGAVRTAYDTAIAAVDAYRVAANAAENPSTRTALESATLAAAATSASAALRELKDAMGQERTGSILTTLNL